MYDNIIRQMHDDGTFLACSNINGPAGRTFLGLGSLLTGAKVNPNIHFLPKLRYND